MGKAIFIHLRVHSAYSLSEGALHTKEICKLCQQQEMPAIAVTDNGNLFGALEFSSTAADAGIQPIIGCVLPMVTASELTRPGASRNAEPLVVLVQNEAGYENLMSLISEAYLTPAVHEVIPSLAYETLSGRTEGLIALTGGPEGRLGRFLQQNNLAGARQQLQWLTHHFPGRLYVEIMRHGMEGEQRTEGGFLDLALEFNIPIVATNDVYFSNADMYEAHDALLCIAGGRYISETERRRLTPEHYFKSADQMAELFSDLPEAIYNTVEIARRCAYRVKSRKPILPRFTVEEGRDISEAELLQLMAREGLEQRLKTEVFKSNPAFSEETARPYWERLQYELDVIIKMDFPGYFLIVSDFIRWSKRHGIPVGPGRGSGAGSVVAWALNITDLDPLRFGLLFERFLNPERISMPDFDVDFCQDRRDEVIRYVQNRYGHDRVAQIITFGKLQARAVLRDVGRVLQMPYGQVDKISKLVPNNPAAPVSLREAIRIEPMLQENIRNDETVDKLVSIALKLEGLYRHASTHAAGVVIADRPLQQLVPLYRDPKSDMPVVQFSMKYAESAGLVKFDFLGLKTLTVLQNAVNLLKARDISEDLLLLPDRDPKTYELLGKGDTVGVFQLESAGMRDTLRRLRPDCLEDIIALVSLYRPGPMDNIPTYVARKHGQERAQYLHPKLEQVLKETYGVIIYQEQVMQIAQLLAGYSLGEADLLRRAMGKKIRSEMEAQREVFVSRAVERGVDEYEARGIFDLIAKFAEYGFNKSHAAAYAVIAYQTAYLKANYPVEFLAASMTYDMHNTDKLSIFRQEAQRFGISLLPPDINASEVNFSVENGAIRYALAAVKNVGAAAMRSLVQERQAHGAYKDIFDFAQRVDPHLLNRRQLEHLIKAGAFDSLHANRRQLLETLDMLISHGTTAARERQSAQASLFGSAAVAISSPVPALMPMEDWPVLERLQHEFSAIGFYLTSHPLQGYEAALKRLGVTVSSNFHQLSTEGYQPVKVVGMVTSTKFKVSARGRFAFVQLSDMAGSYEASVFDEKLLSGARELLESGRLLYIAADGKQDENGPRLIARSITLLEDHIKQDQARRPARHEVRIALDEPQAVSSIKQLLGDSAEQGLKVVLLMRLQGQEEAQVELPGCYLLSPATLQQIAGLNGVIYAREA